jgi:hypothetical protein
MTLSPRTADEVATTAARSGPVASSRSEDAQQLSACAWVSAFPDVDLSDWPRRIGHVPFSSQHAIRASGVAAQPGHTPTFPASRAIARKTVVRRWTKRKTAFRMLDHGSCRQVVWLASPDRPLTRVGRLVTTPLARRACGAGTQRDGFTVQDAWNRLSEFMDVFPLIP